MLRGLSRQKVIGKGAEGGVLRGFVGEHHDPKTPKPLFY